MKIIISPAKQMQVNTDVFACDTLPVLMEKTQILMRWIQSLSYEEQKKLWACNDKIARENASRFAHMDLRSQLTPAILAYDGIQYTYMAPAVFEDGQYDYVQEHLRILSGFYGVVKPMDGVVPYRLEMQAKAAVAGYKNLYDFWGDSLYREVLDSSRTIINLASKEYARCIERYLQPEDRYITCIFGESEGERIVQKGVYAKMARGEMVRFMAGIHAAAPEQMKDFNWSGYSFDEKRSSDHEYVFIRTEVPGKVWEKQTRVPEHICEMEDILDRAAQKIDELERSIAEFGELQPEIKKLEAYYTSQQWKDDFAMDEDGILPENLKRGVLSQDGIWNLLERNKELIHVLKRRKE